LFNTVCPPTPSIKTFCPVKIAITDACIFIDLIELGLTAPFFKLAIEIHTSLDVFNELFPQQRQLLKVFQSVKKLVLHNITADDWEKISQQEYPNALSNSDKTVLYLAAQLKAIVLSSDKAVRHHAKIRKIEYHGMLWVFDMLLEERLLSYQDASQKLKKLILTNIIYQNSTELINEMNNRLKKWDKK
jgi:hypothetical protein